MISSAERGHAPATTRRRGTSGRRKALGLLALMLSLTLLCICSMVLGAKATNLATINQAWPYALDILFGHTNVPQLITNGMESDLADTAGIIASLRIPRTILSILIGIALGLAGAVIQGLTRNPLADPGMLGVSSGAALFVAAGIFLFGLNTITAHLWLAFLGAGLASLLVFGISSTSVGKGATLGLVLAGAALSASFSAITSGIVYIDPNALDTLRFWQAGSVTGRGFDIIIPALVPILIGAILALLSGPTLNVLGLGAETAQALGTNVVRANFMGLITITLLAGAATAAAGPIGFIGLMVPHIARSITGPDYRWILPYSALTGAVTLLAADIIGRLVMRPGELQAGIVIALLGAPVFIWLVRNRKMVSL